MGLACVNFKRVVKELEPRVDFASKEAGQVRHTTLCSSLGLRTIGMADHAGYVIRRFLLI